VIETADAWIETIWEARIDATEDEWAALLLSGDTEGARI